MKKKFILFVVLAAVLGLLAATATADQSTPQLSKANGQSAIVIEPKGASGAANYIIQLKDAPLGLQAGSALDARTPESQAYLAQLDRAQADLVAAASQTLGRNVSPAFSYKHAFNGIVVEMTPAEAAEVAKLPGVTKIYREQFRELLTDAGPTWIGADNLWNGTVPNHGEGTTAAVLDTGINFDHPSFADVGGDGYDHPAPAQYFGVCDPGDSQFDASYTCNDKLVGGYTFVSEAVTPEDSDGHGSHTASTVAGNFVFDATLEAPTISVDGDISGVAPHAQIIAMDVCVTSCPSSALIAAVDKVVELNGLFPGFIDAINYSISGGEDPYNDPVELGFLTANTAGVFVSASAGNSGPGPFTVAHRSPWLTTVAASTHNREFTDNLLNLTSDGGPLPDMAGVGLTTGYGPDNIVYAGDYGDNLCFLGSFPPGTWSGEIVICDRGTNARVEKGQAVLDGGAGGMILADNGGGVVSDPHFLPATHISQTDGTTVKDWVAANTNPMGTIEGTIADFADENGDIMAGFSSRGPNDTFDVIKPSVTAPGVNIWAAVSDGVVAPDGTDEYNLLSGTSMSSPHDAGASLLVKAAHPSWNPQQIQAALMMTAVQDGVLKEDAATPADPFDMGSGRIQVDWAAQAGLVMDETEANFLAAEGDDDLIRALNIPSMANSNCVGGTCSWTRTVQSSVDFTVNWDASSTGEYPVTVAPASFSLAAGASQELTITADASAVADGTWRFANVVLTPSFPAGANGGGGGGTYCSTPGIAIPDNNPTGVNDTITVGDTGSITDVDVTVEATHTWIGDLVFTVAHGSSVTVIDQPGVPVSTFGCSQNHINATLDDEAAAPVEDQCAASPNPTPPPYAIDGAFTPNNALSAFDSGEMSGDWTITAADLVAGDTGTLTEWCVVISAGGGGPVLPPVAHMPVAVIASGGSVPDLVEIEANSSAGSMTVPGFVSGSPVTELQLGASGLVEGSYFSYEMSTDPTNGDPYDNLNDGTVYYEVFNVPAGAHRLVAEIVASESPDIDLFVGTGATPSADTLVCFSATGIALEYCNVDDPAAGDWWVLVQDWEDSGNPPDTVVLSAAVVPDGDAGNFPLSGPASVPAGQPFDVEVGWNEPAFESDDYWYGSFDIGTDAGNPDNVGTTNVNVWVNFPPTIDVNPDSLAASLATDNSIVQALDISNVGTGTLDWNIAEDITAGVDGGVITLTHSASQAIEQFNSVSCNAGGLHTDNSYLRRFNLNDFGIAGNFDVSSVQVGVEQAAGASGSQPITINLYTLSGSFVYANLTLIGTATVNIPDQALTVYEIPVVGTAPAGSELVVELFTPDGQTAGNSFFVGSNNDGQTGASYLVAADCGITEPTDTADIGFPDMHVVMNVLGTEAVAGTCQALVDIPWASVNPTSGSAAAGETDTVDVTFDATGLATGVYTGTLCVTSNDVVNPLVQVPLTLTVEDAAPAITLEKTVGTDPLTCSGTANINVVAGTTVYYCYTVTNTGNVALGTHDLTDDQLGAIFTGELYDLAPGASVDSVSLGFVASAVVMTDTTNVGTWVASVVGGPSASASATATVTVSPAPVLGISLDKTVGTDPLTCGTTDNLQVSAGTVVYYCLTVTNTGTTGLFTHDIVDSILGVNLTGVAYSLLPGEDVNTIELGLTLAYTVTADTTNTAMWMSYDDAGASAMAEDSATVTLAPTDVSLTGFGSDNNVATLPIIFTMVVAFALVVIISHRRRTTN